MKYDTASVAGTIPTSVTGEPALGHAPLICVCNCVTRPPATTSETRTGPATHRRSFMLPKPVKSLANFALR